MPGPTPDPGNNPDNPLADLLRQLGMMRPDGSMPDPAEIMAKAQQNMGGFVHQFQEMFAPAPSGTTLNPNTVRTSARQISAQDGPDPFPAEADKHLSIEAIQLAQQWISDHTSFDPVEGPGTAWSRAEWIEDTLPTWVQITEPVASHLVDALLGLMHFEEQGIDDNAVAAFLPMLRQSTGAMFAAQFGQTLGKLSSEVLTGSDLGLPISQRHHTSLLHSNILSFGEGLDLSDQDLRIYLALREVTRCRLLASIGWLGPQLVALIQHYASKITIDSQALEQAMSETVVENPEGIDSVIIQINETLFEPAKTAEQKEILQRLEVLYALMEGWVDDVVEQAGSIWLPSFAALTEMMRRRRAQGGPAGTALSKIVGLQLRPKLVRDAANLWAAVRSSKGIAERDAVWKHPDLLPTQKDLEDPLGFVENDRHSEIDEIDAELRKLLGGEDQSSR